MDTNQARQIIKETFENSFDKNKFIYFIKNLFNSIEDAPFSYKGNLIPDAYEQHISTLERIGKYTDGEHEIDILIVKLKKETTLERARTKQRNFVAWYLNGSRGGKLKDASLVAFISPNEKDWRFSLVKMDYKFEEGKNGKIKVKEEFTPARRWSFLVGKNEKSHTAQSRLVSILADDKYNPTLIQLEEAFNIEKVTKEFFENYRDLFIRVKEAVDDIIKKYPVVRKDFADKKVDTVDFAKKLMGQIVFLYFLQKKGWFGVEKGKDWGTGSKRFLRDLYDKKIIQYKNFFNDTLEPLFYDALARDHSDIDHYNEHFKTKIPFLNGGLFDPINNYDWVNTDIILPDELFSNDKKTKQGDIGDGILDIFDRYNFTVNEDEPLEKEVAIDPEMLGKVFENLLEVKDRKSKGTYYTPREIVHYMCQQSLINYLATELSSSVIARSETTKQSLPTKEEIESLIKYGEQVGENEAVVEIKGKETERYYYKLPENIRKNAKILDEKLANIKICDPAIGSGAFPVGMMTEIVKTRNVLTTYLSLRDSSPVIASETKQSHSSRHSELVSESSSSVIANEVKQSRSIYNFKRECIEKSLYGVDIDPGAIEIAKLRLWLSLIVDEEDIKQIRPLPNLDYKIVCGNSLLGVKKYLYNWLLFEELEHLKPLLFNETNPTKKQVYKKQIDDLISQITNGHKEFDFEVYFSEVFHEKKGFDVVIANPPYLKERDNKSVFEIVNNSNFGKKYHQGKMDYWYYFLHKAIDISKKEGIISYITSRYWLNSAGASKLIQRVRDELSFVNFVDIGKLKVFDEVAGQHMVAVYSRSKNYNEFIYKKLENDISDIDKNLDTKNIKIKILLNKNIFSNHNEIILETDNLNLQEVLSLGSITDISQGVVEATDKISQKQLKKSRRRDVSAGDGVFVITESELHKLKINQNKKSIFKKYLDPNDVLKYRVAWNNKYLIYSDRKAKHFIKNDRSFTNIKKHLDNLREFITSSNKPYGLHRPRELKYFSNPKIIFKDMFVNNEFTYDEDGYFVGFSFSLIISKDKNYSLKYILAILDSKFALNWFYKYGKKRGAGVDIGVEKLRTFPIKKALPNNQKPFVDLVDKILAITKLVPTKAGNDDYLNNSTKQTKVKEYEHQIDQMVYKLYGLTEDEIEIVENFKK